jgi:hypothetical protein
VEGGVEDGDVRAVGKSCSCGSDLIQSGSVVQGCELGEVGQLTDDIVVDDDRLDET